MKADGTAEDEHGDESDGERSPPEDESSSFRSKIRGPVEVEQEVSGGPGGDVSSSLAASSSSSSDRSSRASIVYISSSGSSWPAGCWPGSSGGSSCGTCRVSASSADMGSGKGSQDFCVVADFRKWCRIFLESGVESRNSRFLVLARGVESLIIARVDLERGAEISEGIVSRRFLGLPSSASGVEIRDRKGRRG